VADDEVTCFCSNNITGDISSITRTIRWYTSYVCLWECHAPCTFSTTCRSSRWATALSVLLSIIFLSFFYNRNIYPKIDFWCLTPLSAIFQLYHGDQFYWWKKPGYPRRTTDYGQATGKLYHLRLRVECALFCNLQSRARTHAVFVIGLYELLGNPIPNSLSHPGPLIVRRVWRYQRDYQNPHIEEEQATHL
jgi:hypothetical protein